MTREIKLNPPPTIYICLNWQHYWLLQNIMLRPCNMSCIVTHIHKIYKKYDYSITTKFNQTFTSIYFVSNKKVTQEHLKKKEKITSHSTKVCNVCHLHHVCSEVHLCRRVFSSDLFFLHGQLVDSVIVTHPTVSRVNVELVRHFLAES